MRDTYSPDRRYFLSHLKRPAFLWKHAGFLVVSVAGRLLTRLRLASRTAHQGSKKWPATLLRERELRISVLEGGLRLPRYKIEAPPGALIAKRMAESRQVEAAIAADRHGDAEVYFAKHRWGWLLDAMLTDDRDDAALFGRVESWISGHHSREERCWETYSACERVVNSLTFLASLSGEKSSVLASPLYCGFIADSLVWIYRHLEYYGDRKTNNHLLNNARTLVVGGVALKNKAAIDAGMRLFRAFLPRIVSDEGVLRERSSHYQLIVLNWLLDAWKFLECRKGKESEDVQFLKLYVKRMSAVAEMFTDDFGCLLATIGDVSPDFSPLQSSLRHTMLFPAFVMSGISPSRVTGGWYRLDSDTGIVLGNYMGSTFPAEFPTHGHNDLVSFCWSEKGEPILTDPGRARYTPDAVSLLQKSAAGHSVTLVNGFAPFCETLFSNGQWWPLPYSRASIDTKLHEGGIAISHNGFSRSTLVTFHHRAITLQQGSRLVVEDMFDGKGTVKVALLWHVSSFFDDFDEEKMMVCGIGGRWLKIRIMDAESRQEISAVDKQATLLRESPCYGVEHPSLGLNFSLVVVLPATIRTEFMVSTCVE